MAATEISNHYAIPKTKLNYTRSIHKYERTHTTNMLTGYIYPLGFINAMPGDTLPNKFGFILQSAPLLGPCLDNIYIDIISVWCPTRLVFAQHNQWLGDNDTLAWTIPNDASSALPKLTKMLLGCDSNMNSFSRAYYAEHYRAPHYGLRYFNKNAQTIFSGSNPIVGSESVFSKGIQVIPWRMYDEIWNKLFRNENIQAPQLYSKASGTDLSLDVSHYFEGGGHLLRACRLKNIFTMARIAPSIQMVDVLAGVNAPVVTPSTDTKILFGMYKESSGSRGTFVDNSSMQLNTGSSNLQGSSSAIPGGGSSAYAYTTNLIADLSSLTVNNLYYSIMLQRYFNKASTGRRPAEFYHEFFGVDSSLVGADDPQLLSQKRFKVNISRVVSTANSTDAQGSLQGLGTQGAFSLTSVGGTLFPAFTATEYGMLHVFAVIRTQESISSGIDKYLADDTLLTTYLPVFDHIGDEAIERLELADATTNNATRVFGYNSAWYRYRYFMNDVVGILSPSEPLGYMTMAREFLAGSITGVNSDFIEQSPLEFDRLLQFPVFYNPSGVDCDDEGEPYESNRYQWLIQFALAGDFARTMSKDSEQLTF